jgi:hypothetical protein
MKLLGFGVLVLALSAAPARASDLRLEFQDGTVTLSARDVPVRQILAEWARKGQTRIVNGERLGGGPVTLELRSMPEGKALDIVLRSAAGYLAAPRPAAVPGASSFDRIVVLATSTAPPPTAVARTQPMYRPPVMPQPSANVMPGMVDPGVNPMPAMPQPGVNDMPDEYQDQDQDDTNVMPPGGMGEGEAGETGDGMRVPPQFPGMQNATIPGMQNGTTPAGVVYVPGAQPPQLPPDASNPLRAFMPPQPAAQPEDPNAAQPVPQPGPTPFQPGAITTGAPGQVQAPPQQDQDQNPPPQ